MRTQNLFNGKPEGGFYGLAAVLLSFGLAFAVFAAGGMVLAGCDNLAGAGTGDESAFGAEVDSAEVESAEAEAAAPEDGSAGGPSLAASGAKTIKIKFNVKNGGSGLWNTEGMIATWDNSKIVYNKAICANDYTITITVPEADDWVNVYWKVWAADFFEHRFYLVALAEAKSGTIVLDYNGVDYHKDTKEFLPKVATKNLSNVEITRFVYDDSSEKDKFAGGNPFAGYYPMVWDEETQKEIPINEYWDKLKAHSVKN